MAWKNFVGPNAITSRRRVVASALMYGLSLTVRFTSPTGEEAENPAQATQGNNPMSSIVINDGAQIFKSWPESRSLDRLSTRLDTQFQKLPRGM